MNFQKKLPLTQILGNARKQLNQDQAEISHKEPRTALQIENQRMLNSLKKNKQA
jgi:hypothetical protein